MRHVTPAASLRQPEDGSVERRPRLLNLALPLNEASHERRWGSACDASARGESMRQTRLSPWVGCCRSWRSRLNGVESKHARKDTGATQSTNILPPPVNPHDTAANASIVLDFIKE